MKTVLNFIKSLFMPRQMQRFRYMSILISICLFVLTIYVFRLPVNEYYKRHTDKMVDEQNLCYLQSIKEIPTNGENIAKVVNSLKDKGLVVENGTLKATNMGVSSAVAKDNVLGILTRNSISGYWDFNDTNTGVSFSEDVNVAPTVIAKDGGINLSNTSSLIEIPGVTSTDEINIIRVTVNNLGKLSIDEVIYENYIEGPIVNIAIVDNKLVVNDIITSKETTGKNLIYFIPNTNVTYYKTNLIYQGTDGITKNIEFVIDLSITATTSITADATSNDFEGDLNNCEYFYIYINSASIFYQAHPNNINDANIEHNGKKLSSTLVLNNFYSNYPIDFSAINVSNFGSEYVKVFENAFIAYEQTLFSLASILYCIVFTLIIAFLFFLLFKRQGKMKTFREYYNIAAIANIVPVILTFIMLWFIPDIFTYVYIFSFGAWYLFVCYRINSSPDIV